MSKEESIKMLGEDRRDWLLKTLKESDKPITGGTLAKETNVSRQVIVGDITLLKARNEPIIATSQGYLYMALPKTKQMVEETIACFHQRNQAEEELHIIVDHGVTVKDVKVEHPVYGDLTASIMVSNRREVQLFLSQIKDTNAALLSDLTSGIHLHTLVAPSEEAIKKTKQALKEAGILIEEN